MDKRKKGNLLLEQTLSQPMVIRFLDAKERRSSSTKKTYSFGLAQFQTFLSAKYPGKGYTLESILQALAKKKINVYELLDDFIQYLYKLNGERKLSSNSIKGYLNGIRSYLQKYDIDIVPSKFRNQVTLTKTLRHDEEPVDASDIRKILKACNNRRLRAFLLVLGSGGFRAMEAITLRLKDVDFDSKPTRVHVRAEFTKTRVERYVYISDEATEVLKRYLDFKYRIKYRKSDALARSPDDIIFSTRKTVPSFEGIYIKIKEEFNKILETVGMGERKEGMLRRKFTFHTLRRYVYTTICDQTADQAYAEWFLGHSKSPYHTKKEEAKREFYEVKCMPALTFLNFEQLEKTGRNINAKLLEKDRQIAYLRDRDTTKEDAISNLSDQLMKVNIRMQEQDKLIQELLKKK